MERSEKAEKEAEKGRVAKGQKPKEERKVLPSSSPERTKATALRRLSSNLFYVVNPPPPLRRRRGCFYPLSSQGERSAWRKDGMRDAGGGGGKDETTFGS